MCSNSNITNQVPISFILYPLIPFFSQLGSIICQLRFYSNLSWNESLIGFALISNNIAGFFMLLLFFVGPFLWVKIRKWKRQNNHWGLLFWSGKKKRDYDHDDNHSDINSKSDITLNHSYHQHQHQQQRQPANIIYQSESSTKSSMKKNHSHHQNNNNKNKNNNNLLSIRSSMTGLNTFIENDPSPPPHHAIKKDDLLKYPPTSLQLEEADLVDMFTKTPTAKSGFTIDITSNSLSSQATTIAVSPTSPTAKFLAPICYEMEDAVPWRVLEADESEDESEEDDIIIYQQKDILNPPSAVLTTTSITSITNSSSFLSKRYSTVPPPPRISSSTNRSSIYNPRKESWLALYDDDLINDNNNDDEENQSHASNSLHSVSQWLSKRGDSLDIVREQVGRTSKSIRRWCKQQQQFNHHQEMDSMESGLATTAATTSHHTGLHVVQEEQP
ncbi:hypothetical protein BJ944DRAFT_104018 [Cunninghamella echinulata]|nr:hypothetical protein BJ944DRAFT_104018 [Cunninghamella echinulata]